MRAIKTLAVFAVVALLAACFPAAAAGLVLIPGTTTEVTDMDSAMKIFFTDPIVQNFVEDTELMDLFTQDSNVQTESSTGGRYIETAQYFSLPAGVGSRAPGDYLPVPEGPVIRNSRVYLKKHMGVLQMTGDVMERVRGDLGAYIDYMERALPDFLTAFNDVMDRQHLGYGNGALAKIDEINGLAVTVIDAFGVTGWGPCWFNFQEGMRVVASVAADGDPIRNAGAGQSGKVTDIDDIDDIITFDAVPAAWAPGDFLFMGDASGVSTQTAAGDDRELMGLAGLVDDGSILTVFQNLDRGDFRLWRSIVVDGNTGPFTGELNENVLIHADNQVFTRGKGKPNVFVTSRDQATKYWDSLKGDRMLINPKNYEGGKGSLSIRLSDRVLELRVARKMPNSLAYLLQTDSFKRWQLDSGKWDDKTGSIWNRVTDGTGRKDDFYAVYIHYSQNGNLAPRRSVRIENLQ